MSMTAESESSAKLKEKGRKKDKDRSEKKQSKKRRHDEAETRDHDAPLREGSPAKKTKTTSKSSQDYLKPASERNGDASPIYKQTASLHLPLSPVSTMFPIHGICAEHLSPMIMTYFQPLDGLILGYNYRNIRVSDSPPRSEYDFGPALAKQVDEYAAANAWVTVDFLILKLRPGLYVDGVLNLQSESHLGLLLWNQFNVSIPREHLPRGWKWVESDAMNGISSADGSASDWESRHDLHGHFEDSRGGRLPQRISVRIRDIEAARSKDAGYFSISATMLSEEEQAKIEAKQAEEHASQVEAVQKSRRQLATGSPDPEEDRGIPPLVTEHGSKGKKNKHRMSY